MSQPFKTSDNVSIPHDSVPNVTVSVGQIQASDFNANYKTPTVGKTTTDYRIRNRFVRKSNRYAAGITSPNGFQGASVAFFQLAAPTLIWVSEWTACRMGEIPDVPDSESRDANWVLLDEYVEPYMTSPGPDGVTFVYRISGVYTYGKKNPSKVATVMDVGFALPPWVERPPTVNLSLSNLKAGLIDAFVRPSSTPRRTTPT